MSVYNGADYLQEAIDSILSQTYTGFEFVILDDCSIDGTWDILRKNADRDSRIVLIQNEENLGLIRSLNKGLKAAQGEFIARQDADDISSNSRLEKEVKILDEQADCVLVSSNIQVVENDNKKVIEVMHRYCEPDLIAWYLLFYNRIAGHSQVMYRRDFVLSLGGYSEDHPYIEDYELWCRIARTKKKLVILPEIFLTYRRHSQSVSAQKVQEQQVNRIQQVKNNLQALLQRDIPIEEAKYLMGFWKANRTTIFDPWHHRFPPASKAALVHLRLKEIKNRFLEEYQISDDNSKLAQQLDTLIGKQFLYWLRSPLTSRHSLHSKFQVSRYALAWSPFGLPKAWLIWLLRLPVDAAISILRKLQILEGHQSRLRLET
ncbi:MAG: glycosyltransferase [Cyanothece sp. SIO1E1]|nr:glycosyltransferase [Cyanothece sp. SIO1E1]